MERKYFLVGIILAGLIIFSGCTQSPDGRGPDGRVKTSAPSLPPILVFSSNQPVSSEADVKNLFTDHAAEIRAGIPGNYSSYYGSAGFELKPQTLKITDIPPVESIVYGGYVGESLGERIGNITSEWAVQISGAPSGVPIRAAKDPGVYEYLAGTQYVQPDTGISCLVPVGGTPTPPSGCVEREYWQNALQFIFGVSSDGEVVLSSAFELGLEKPIPGAQY